MAGKRKGRRCGSVLPFPAPFRRPEWEIRGGGAAVFFSGGGAAVRESFPGVQRWKTMGGGGVLGWAGAGKRPMRLDKGKGGGGKKRRAGLGRNRSCGPKLI